MQNYFQEVKSQGEKRLSTLNHWLNESSSEIFYWSSDYHRFSTRSLVLIEYNNAIWRANQIRNIYSYSIRLSLNWALI